MTESRANEYRALKQVKNPSLKQRLQLFELESEVQQTTNLLRYSPQDRQIILSGVGLWRFMRGLPLKPEKRDLFQTFYNTDTKEHEQ
jgi:hypothetical protein